MDISRSPERKEVLSKIDVYVRGYGRSPRLTVSVNHTYDPTLPVPYDDIDEEPDVSRMRNDENWAFSFRYSDKDRPYIAYMDQTDDNIMCAMRRIQEYIVNRYFFNTVLVEIPMYISFYKEKEDGFFNPLRIGEKLCRT